MSDDGVVPCDLLALSKKQNSSYSERLSTYHLYPIQLRQRREEAAESGFTYTSTTHIHRIICFCVLLIILFYFLFKTWVIVYNVLPAMEF